MMEASCYCTNHGSETPFLDQASGSMDLDSALHELGMLSSVTDSRVSYLKERLKSHKKRQHPSISFPTPPVCIVQMNSKFVTKFSLSKDTFSDNCSEPTRREVRLHNSYPMKNSIEDKDAECYHKMTKRLRYERRRRLGQKYNPYDFPWRSKLEDSLRNIPASTAAAAATIAVTERASSPVVSRQDSGNKSNPSSPVKSQNSLTTSGSSIVRSRSLDDLEIGKLEDCKEDSYVDCYSGRSDIDNVSQRISKLYVS